MNVIAIDGPSGSGKSTIAKKVAQKLGWLYLNTGAMYRALGIVLSDRGYDLEESDPAIAQELLSLKFEYGINATKLIQVDGKDFTESIKEHRASELASKVSRISEVRDYLKQFQRDLAHTRPSVLDGRDIGTVIFPDAFLKIFLTAKPEVRAKRRLDELNSENNEHSFEEILNDIKKRDHQDQTRELAPLKQAKDAILIDASNLDIDQVVNQVIRLVQERQK